MIRSRIWLAAGWLALASTQGLTHNNHEGALVEILPAGSLEDVEIYLEAYRQSGNDHLLEGAAAFFSSTPPGAQTPEWHLRAAWLAQARHEFRTALAHTEVVLAQSGDVSVWLLQANLHRLLGHAVAARRACQQVIEQQILLGQLCLEQVRRAHGTPADHARIEQLARISVLPGATSSAPAIRAWVAGTLADLYLEIGEPARALEFAEHARMLEPTIQRRAAAARLWRANGHPRRALDISGQTPNAPALAIESLAALKGLRRLPQARTWIQELDARFRRDIARDDFAHAREMAMFYLEIHPSPELAGRLARVNWAAQKEPEDRQLLLRCAQDPDMEPAKHEI